MTVEAWRAALAAPFAPLRETLAGYDRGSLARDLSAGLTVAVVEVPQAMAYAYVAGVPPQYGLYTSIVQGAVSALFSSSQHLASGPTNTQSLLVAAVVSRASVELGGAADPAFYLGLVFALTLFKGVLQLALAASGMAGLVRYVSQSVVVGFTAGAGLLIAAGQLPALLGLGRSALAQPPGVLATLRDVSARLAETDARALAIGAASLALLLLLRRFAPKLPAALLTLAAGALAARLSGWDAAGLPVVGELPRALPRPALPALGARELEALFGGAFALATLGAIETLSIVRTLATRTGERVSADRELIAQGVANCVGAFFQNVAGSGSFTRSALGVAAGARTRLASLFGAASVALILLLLAPLAAAVPRASLAAILVTVGLRLVDLRFVARVLRADRADAAVCLATGVSALIAPLHQAIFVGMFLNIALYLRRASPVRMTEMRSAPGGVYEERPLQDVFGRERVVLLQVEGVLFFGMADELRERFGRVLRSDVQVVILRLKRTHGLDATVLLVLEELALGLKREGRHLLLCGLSPELAAALRRFGLVRIVGEENVFESGPGVFSSARRALARAEEIVGPVAEGAAPA